MRLPFSIDEFLGVFEKYNKDVWPAQIIHFILALVAVGMVVRKEHSNRAIFVILAFFWMWMGIVYHIRYFSPVNPAAKIFGGLFIVQAFIFIYEGAIKSSLELTFNRHWTSFLGIVLIIYALIGYPLLGYSLGHAYPKSPTFGVPCPTTIFSLGILMFSAKRIAWYVFIIPLLWSLIGFSAAIALEIKEDYGLFLAGLLFAFIQLFYRNKSQ